MLHHRVSTATVAQRGQTKPPLFLVDTVEEGEGIAAFSWI